MVWWPSEKKSLKNQMIKKHFENFNESKIHSKSCMAVVWNWPFYVHFSSVQKSHIVNSRVYKLKIWHLDSLFTRMDF